MDLGSPAAGQPPQDMALINPALNLDPAIQSMQNEGKARILDVLSQAFAEDIYTVLTRETPWELAWNEGETNHSVHPEDWRKKSQQEQSRIHQGIMERASKGQFQFFYHRYSMIDNYLAGRDPGHMLHTVTEFLNSPDFLDIGRRLTGRNDIVKADAQATYFARNQFLTLHQDRQDGQSRVAAYVLSFCKQWRADWGGLLIFPEAGSSGAVWVPGFNSLACFTVPRDHLVTTVAPFAPFPRLAITGWFHDKV